MKGLSKEWLADTVRDVMVVMDMHAWCFAFDVNDRSVHGFATEDHSMWKFHSNFCYGCEIPYRSSCHGSSFHCCWPQGRSLTRCHCPGHPFLSLFCSQNSLSSLLPPPDTTNPTFLCIKAPKTAHKRNYTLLWAIPR